MKDPTIEWIKGQIAKLEDERNGLDLKDFPTGAAMHKAVKTYERQINQLSDRLNVLEKYHSGGK